MLFELGLLLAVVTCAWLFLDVAHARGPLARRLPFLALAACAGLWATGEMLVLDAVGPTERHLGRRILYVGAGFFPVAWLWASSSLARPAWYRRAPWLLAVPLAPMLGAAAWLYPELNERFAETARFGLRAGPVYWSVLYLGWGLVALGIGQLVLAGARLARPSVARLVLIGGFASAPLVWSLVYMLGRLEGPDPTPILLGICGVAVRFAVFDAGLAAVLPGGQWAIFDQLPTGVLLADTSGVVVDANPAAERLAGRERPVGRSLDALLAEVSADPERTIEVSRVPLRRRLSGAVGWAALLTDRTEATRLEQHLHAQQRLESLALLAGGLAHDFQNLLTRILAGVGLARMTLEPRHAARGPLGDVVRGAHVASQITRQLLGLSGQGAGRREPLLLSAEVDQLRGLLTSWVPRGVALDLDLPPGLPAVEADRSEVHQLVTNLTVNAAQATVGGGLVQVRTGAVVLDDGDLGRLVPGSPARPGLYALLEVSDDGRGMDGATVSRIFEPFFSRRDTGYGLGLAAVLGIAHRLGGGVEVESEPGVGSTFRVFLPTSSAEPAAAPARRERALHVAGQGTVLVVEDEDALREIVSGALERVGYTALRAEDGSEALEIFRERGDEVDVVLLDLDMPGLGGLETGRALRELRQDVPIVLASVLHDDQSPPPGTEFAASVLRKPYDLDALFAAVQDVLASGAVRSAAG